MHACASPNLNVTKIIGSHDLKGDGAAAVYNSTVLNVLG